ncbi:MAG: protein-export chaperone SecB [Bacteroidia bacterium]|nr:protein-export chaperone SecB [Bacteroidia bacterium]
MEKQPGFQFHSISLLESTFKRQAEIDFQKLQEPHVVISTNFEQSESRLICFLELDFKVAIDQKPLIECNCKFVGVFEIIGTPLLNIENFGTVNAPSILFPFIREHIAGLSLKAGINPILLPPVNFVALAANNKKSIDKKVD